MNNFSWRKSKTWLVALSGKGRVGNGNGKQRGQAVDVQGSALGSNDVF